MRCKICRLFLLCYLWMTCKWFLCSTQQPKCHTEITLNCEMSVSFTNVYGNATTANFVKCFLVQFLRDTLQNLTLLQALSIRCDFHGDIHLEIETGLFSPMQDTLSDLKLSHNNILTIPEGTFCELKNLTKLNLTYNRLQDITHVGFGTGCEEQLPTSNLDTLTLHDNSIRAVRNGTFGRLSKLVYLDISHNGLTDIEIGAFEGLVALKTLDLSHNKLVSIPDHLFVNVPQLYNLNLNENRLLTSGLSPTKYPPLLGILTLSNNRLTSIKELASDGLSYVTQLDLSGNQFKVLESGFGSLSSLASLSISEAGLKRITPEAFQGLDSLSSLKLNGNRLTSIEVGTFRNCPNLQHLDVSDNLLDSMPDTTDLSDLKTINLHGNNITTVLDMAHWSSTTLQSIDLSGNAIENIERVPGLQLTSVTKFNLSYNAITRIEPGAFDWMWHKNFSSSVYLDFNQLTTIKGVFTTSNVTVLSLSHNKLRDFYYSSIPTGLKSLDLSHNRIAKLINDVSPALFQKFRLKTMDLSHNSLENITDNSFPHSIQGLFLHNNAIHRVDQQFLQPLAQLQNLTLHNNLLQLLCPQMIVSAFLSPPLLTTTLSGNPFACTCDLEWVREAATNLRGNYGYIKDMPKIQCRNTFPKYGSYEVFLVRSWRTQKYLCNSTYDNPNSCQCAASEQVQTCDVPCPKNCTCYRNKAFAIADCSLANLTTVPAVTFADATEVHLYLDGNLLEYLNGTEFELQSNVTKLFLNSSHVRSVTVNAFRHLPSLTVLHLEDNFLQALPSGLFDESTSLTELYLDHNQLTELNIEILLPLTSLRVLDLSNNLLHRFDVPQLQQLPTLANVSLQQNPWSCECQFVESFRKWLQEYLKIANDAQNLSCMVDGTNQIPLISSSFTNCHQASTLEEMAGTAAIWGSILGVVLLLITVSVLVFVYRREMEVILYSRFGVRVFSRSFQESEDGKPYDAFVSYSNLDEEFLVYQLLPGLERIENPYRLCLHHRDFMAGAFITENIMAAVEKSRRTILLLSDNFIQSEWCRFEFKAAHIQMLKDRCSRVIVIVLGKIPKDLDPEMKLYLDTNTYLTWGEKLFWKRLYFAMPDKKEGPLQSTLDIRNPNIKQTLL